MKKTKRGRDWTILIKRKKYQFVHPLSADGEPIVELLHHLVKLLQPVVEVVDHLQLLVHALEDGHSAFQVLDLKKIVYKTIRSSLLQICGIQFGVA